MAVPRTAFRHALAALYDWLDTQLGGDLSVLSAAEIAFLNGVVAGTVVAGKAVVATTGKVVDELDITLIKIGGSNKTTALTAAVVTPVAGVAAGYKLARSAAPVSLDGSNPTTVASGLTSIVAAFAQLAGSAAPGASTIVLTCVINSTDIDVYAWKVTTGGASGNPTLVASGGTETFNWFAIGT